MNFGVLGFLWLWGWGGGLGGWGWGVVEGYPPHMCTCMCTHTHTHTRMCMRGEHDNSMQMAAPIGFGEIPGIPYDVICAYVCMCLHLHMCGGDPVTISHPHQPNLPPPRGVIPGISQNSIALELIEIFQFCLKI